MTQSLGEEVMDAATKRKLIYLAGKVHGDKWNLIRNVPITKARFIASDGESKLREDNDHISFHGYYQGHAHDFCFESFESYLDDFTGKYSNSRISEDMIDDIDSCSYMIAYLNTADSYGTIAEIAYASAKGKPVLVLINNDMFPKDETDEAFRDMVDLHDFWDKFWFVLSFPKVTRFVGSFNNCQEIVENFCLSESPIEEIFFVECIKRHLFLISQKEFTFDSYPTTKKFRVDFLVKDTKMVVEIDGHDYHKTKEQRTYDSERERFFIKEGYTVVRFTGTEIFVDVSKKVSELKTLVYQWENKK